MHQPSRNDLRFVEGLGTENYVRFAARQAVEAGVGRQVARIMLAALRSALDLPLRILVREAPDGQAIASLHPIETILETLGTPAPLAARLAPVQTLLLKAIEP